jgi:hypothetical protein
MCCVSLLLLTMCWYTCAVFPTSSRALTNSFTYSCTQARTHEPTHSRMQPLTHSSTYPPSPPTHPPTHSLVNLLNHSITHSNTNDVSLHCVFGSLLPGHASAHLRRHLRHPRERGHPPGRRPRHGHPDALPAPGSFPKAVRRHLLLRQSGQGGFIELRLFPHVLPMLAHLPGHRALVYAHSDVHSCCTDVPLIPLVTLSPALCYGEMFPTVSQNPGLLQYGHLIEVTCFLRP